MEGVVIRPLVSLDELQAAETLQRQVWDAPTTVIYQPMLISFVRNGGSVIGALKDGVLIGLLIGYLGMEAPDADRPAMANLKLVSQRMAIAPEFRDSGIGFEMKLAQRRFALRHGIRLVTWTFDPLVSRNAHLNVRKLGAVIYEYHRDYFGTAHAPLVAAESSDRVMAEWWVTSNRVEQRLSGRRAGLNIEQYLSANARLLNPSGVAASGLPTPPELMEAPQSSVVLLEIPESFEDILKNDVLLALAWRQHSRVALETVLRAGYTATDFVHDVYEGRMRSFYALSYDQAMDFRTTAFSSN
jgi:predicted GNAT superfamily acetyltransferase